MEPLWSRLGELRMPVTVVVGERDTKYVDLGQKLIAHLGDGELRVVAGGHRLPLENPAAVAEAITGLSSDRGRDRTASGSGLP